jgi:hypothetical protein
MASVEGFALPALSEGANVRARYTTWARAGVQQRPCG